MFRPLRRKWLRTLLKETEVGQNIESEVSAFLVLAAADSAIGQIACLVVLKFPSREMTFVALVGHASR